MKYDWIFFDLDNTLIDFNIASKKAFFSLMDSHGIPRADALYPLYQQINFEAWKDFEKGKIDAITLRSRRFKDFYFKTGYKDIDPLESNSTYLSFLVDYTTTLEGAIDLLNHLKGNVKLAAITNGLKEAQRPRLSRLNLTPYFDAIIVSDEIGFAKPQKEYFDYVMKETNQPSRENTLVVGDSLHSDIQGGNNYGIPTCWCNLFGQINKTGIVPNFEINDLSSLKALL